MLKQILKSFTELTAAFLVFVTLFALGGSSAHAVTVVKNDGVPVGTVIASYATTAPPGYLYCNGASVLRSAYPALFRAIGTAAGAADGTHFNLPDLRGQFLRGQADGQSTDPDRASRTAAKTGGNTGDNVGSAQGDDFRSHSHSIQTISNNGHLSGGIAPINTSQAPNDLKSTLANGGNETRPVNIAVRYYIKY